jgi:hypothetical protein
MRVGEDTLVAEDQFIDVGFATQALEPEYLAATDFTDQ